MAAPRDLERGDKLYDEERDKTMVVEEIPAKIPDDEHAEWRLDGAWAGYEVVESALERDTVSVIKED